MVVREKNLTDAFKLRISESFRWIFREKAFVLEAFVSIERWFLSAVLAKMRSDILF